MSLVHKRAYARPKSLGTVTRAFAKGLLQVVVSLAVSQLDCVNAAQVEIVTGGFIARRLLIEKFSLFRELFRYKSQKAILSAYLVRRVYNVNSCATTNSKAQLGRRSCVSKWPFFDTEATF